MKKALLTTFLGLTTGLGAIYAQQRIVLLEHFTQASCGPCASQNPALNALLDNNLTKVVAIKYQTSWPGTDPMNAANPSDVASRVSYYNVTGVPNSVMEGNFYNGSPSGVNQTKINQRYNVPAGINLKVNYSIIDNADPINDSMVVTGKLFATQELATGHVLHLACIERIIEFASAPGSNGEKKFESVMKKMLPSASGTVIPAMAVGDSMEVSYKWSLKRANGTDAYYNLGQAAAVGFVQNTSTKAILQAGYDEPRPWLSLSRPEGSKTVKIKSNEDLEFALSAVSKSEMDQFVKIVPTVIGLPTGWTVSILADGNTYTGEATIPLFANTSKDIVVKVTGDNTDNSNKKLSVKIDVNSETILPGVKSTMTFTAVTPSNILYMDLPGTATSRFSASFTSATQPYVYLNSEETPNLDNTGLTSSAIKKIYYSTGAAFSGTLTEYMADAFTSYLNSGGNLFVIGQDMGYDMGQGTSPSGMDFYNQYLAADFLADGLTGSVGVAPDETDEFLAPHFPSGFTIAANAASYPDQIGLSEQAIGTAGSFLYYSSGNGDAAAGVYNYTDTWKTVYVPFRMESIPTGASSVAFRNNLIATTNKWFDGILTSNEMIQNMKAIAPAFPNPAKNMLNVPVATGKGKISLTTVSGQLVKTIDLNGSQNATIQLPLNTIPAGMYFLTSDVAGNPVTVQKVVVQ